MPPPSNINPAQPPSEPSGTPGIVPPPAAPAASQPQAQVYGPAPAATVVVNDNSSQSPSHQKPIEILSYNSKTIKRSRSSTRFFNFLGLVVALALVGGLFAVWMSAGSPTSLQDVPFLDKLLHSN